jgi:hypothetical protein
MDDEAAYERALEAMRRRLSNHRRASNCTDAMCGGCQRCLEQQGHDGEDTDNG